MSILIALYDNLDNAKEAVSDLKNMGIDNQDLHLATYDKEARGG